MQIILVVILISIIVECEIYFYATYILPNITYRCRLSEKEIIEGDTVEIIETVSNPTRFMISCLKSEITTSKYLEFGKFNSIVNDRNRSLGSMFAIGSRQRVTRSWKAVCTKRGVYKVEDTTIVSMDLLNFYRASQLVKVKDELVVLPKPISIKDELICCKDNQGEKIVKRFILQDPFVISGVREYTGRESFNQIHWRLSARHNELMVRNNEAVANKNVLIAFNMKVYAGQDRLAFEDSKIEKGIKVVAGLMEEVASKGLAAQFMSNAPLKGTDEPVISREVSMESGKYEILRILARLECRYVANFNQLILDCNETASSDLIIVCCYLTDELVMILRQKMRCGIHVRVCMMDETKRYDQYSDLEIYYLQEDIEKEEAV